MPAQLIGIQSDQAYYQATPATVAKAWGTVNGPNHNDVQGQPDCAHASVPCVNGVYGYLGYPTAWFRDQLAGDARAHSAFVAGSDAQKLLEGGDGLRTVAGSVRDDAFIEEGIAVARPFRQYRLQFLECSAVLAERVECGGIIGPHGCVVRIITNFPRPWV